MTGAPNFALAGELLLAAGGLWPSAPLTREAAAKAQKLPREWADELDGLLTGAKPTKPWRAPAVRYLATWKRINGDEASDDLASQIALPQIRAAYVQARTAALSFLRDSLLPIQVQELGGVGKPRLLEPSMSEQQRANALVAVVNDPGRIVYGLRAGLISPDYLDALNQVYPATQDWLRRTIAQLVFRQQAQRASYRVPYEAEVVLQPLLGLPPGGGGSVIADGKDQGSDGADQPQDQGSASQGPASEVPDIQIRRERQTDQTKADRVSDMSPDAP